MTSIVSRRFAFGFACVRGTLFLGMAVLAVALSAAAQVNVLTQQYDNTRQGQNTAETSLTPSNVNSTTFGKLFALTVDAQVYAQPLYVKGLSIAGGTHNVVFAATEKDSVYAFDADAAGSPLWQASVIDTAHGAASGATWVTSTQVGCTDLQPNIGITTTPVIDLATNTMFVEAKSFENGAFVHRLHALDITTGAEKSPGPVVITATVPGTGDGSSNGQITFDAMRQHARPGLLLLNGTIYVAFASHCDSGPYHGWLFAYNESTFAQTSVINVTPNGGLGGFWMAGSGMAADSSGNLYMPTGNGTFDTNKIPAIDLGDSLLKIALTSGKLSVNDYFTPWNQSTLDSNDIDLGSGGAILLPDQAGTFVHEVVQVGKDGDIRVLNRDQLTANNLHFCVSNCNMTDPQIVQEIQNQLTGMWGKPAYWNNTLYFGTNGDFLKLFSLSNGTLSTTFLSHSPNSFGFPGTTPTVSSNGTTNGIVWAIDSSHYGSPGPGPSPAVLYAYDATNLSTELYNSSQAAASRDKAGNAVKFTVPIVTNGKVYIGTSTEVDVYGLLSSGGGGQVATPVLSPPSETFTGSVQITITDSTSGSTIFYTTDGSMPTPGSGTTIQYVNPFTLTATTRVKAIATAPNMTNSRVAMAAYRKTK